MPSSAPVYRPAGYRTANQRRQDWDRQRLNDTGRIERKKLYDSKAWQELRELARSRDPLCVDCKAEGKVVPWTDLDHIIDIADGGAPLSFSNVQGRCKSHHSKKTVRTRGFQSI